MASTADPYATKQLRYGDHPRQFIQLYIPAEAYRLPLLVFLHGGAWRTGSIDEHHNLASSLAAAGTCCVALVEYRLSLPTSYDAPGSSAPIIQDQHPAHIEDTHLALKHLIIDADPQDAYDSSRVFLSGHSVGAWLISSLLLDATPAFQNPRRAPLSRTECLQIRRATQAWILIDGIYDLQDLLVEYPEYAGFVAQAFVPSDDPPLAPSGDERLRHVSLSSWLDAGDELDKSARVIVAHSKEDELLTVRQSQRAAKYLRTVLASSAVEEDYDSLKGTHDGLLQTASFRGWLTSIIRSAHRR